MGIRVVIAIFSILLLSACATEPKKTMEVSSNVTSNFSDQEIQVWLLYGLKLSECRQSPIYNEFDCQVSVREEAARYWGKLKARESVKSEYFDELELVYQSGFMREYIWQYIFAKTGEIPSELRLTEFDAWAKANIPEHKAIVNPGINFK